MESRCKNGISTANSTNVLINSPPSGSSGLMLGLILGRKAGDTRAEPLPLTLPLFLLPLVPFASDFLSLSRAPGVLAVKGEPATTGLAAEEEGRADTGVLAGPSFGVLRAVSRGVASVDAGCTLVSICGKDGRGDCAIGAAAAGSWRSSNSIPGVSSLSAGCEALCFEIASDPLRMDSRDLGVAAGPVVLEELGFCFCFPATFGDCRLEAGLGGGRIRASLRGSGLMLPFSDVSWGGICSPADEL